MTHPILVAHLLKELQNEAKHSAEWDNRLNSVVARLAERSLEGYIPSSASPNETGEATKRKELLTALLNTFKHQLFTLSDGFREQLDAVISNEKQAYELLRASPAVFIAVLGYRGFDEAGVRLAQGAWKAVLSNLVDPATLQTEREGHLKALVDAAHTGTLPQYLRVYQSAEGDGALDDFIGRNMSEALGGRREGVDLLRVVLKHHSTSLMSPPRHASKADDP